MLQEAAEQADQAVTLYTCSVTIYVGPRAVMTQEFIVFFSPYSLSPGYRRVYIGNWIY
jgi:hypothetical protein